MEEINQDKAKAAGYRISPAVIKRLPRYFRYLRELKEAGRMRISSGELSKMMNVTASQIRQDLNCFGGFGQQGYGYNIDKLQEELGAIMGLRTGRTAILLGAGNLGRALLNNFNFSASGFELLCAFDANPQLIGQRFGGHEVRSADTLAEFIECNKPDVAVLTIPRGDAPRIARGLVERGIRGLWNFTGEDLHLEGLGVPVENVHLSDSLMTLCHLVGAADEKREQNL